MFFLLDFSDLSKVFERVEGNGKTKNQKEEFSSLFKQSNFETSSDFFTGINFTQNNGIVQAAVQLDIQIL